MEYITSQVVAEKLAAYLHHELSLVELTTWAEHVMMEGEFSDKDHETLRDIVSRLGLADVKEFGLGWEDCEEFLRRLGYTVRIEVMAH